MDNPYRFGATCAFVLVALRFIHVIFFSRGTLPWAGALATRLLPPVYGIVPMGSLWRWEQTDLSTGSWNERAHAVTGTSTKFRREALC